MKWQPIETAPRDGSEVLIYGDGSYAVARWDGREWRDMGDIGWDGMYGGESNMPTHWAPLEPPGDEDELRARLQAVESWQQEGEAMLERGRGASLMFWLGGWWADRPWRSKA